MTEPSLLGPGAPAGRPMRPRRRTSATTSCRRHPVPTRPRGPIPGPLGPHRGPGPDHAQ